jgi:hypothetical protein
MKKKSDRHAWIIKAITERRYVSADVLSTDFVTDFAQDNEVNTRIQMFGAPKCDRLGEDLADLYKSGQLTRHATGLTGMAGMGFPPWVYVYDIPKK